MSGGMRLRLEIGVLAVIAVLAAVAAAHLYDPAVPAPRADEWDLCNERRPDGTIPAACAPDPAGSAVTLLFAGDTALADAAVPTLEREGLDYPFGPTADHVRLADFAVFNQEASIVDGVAAAPRWKEYLYRAPPGAAFALARAGLDLAGLANNHSIDWGTAGLRETRAALDAASIRTIGAGDDEASARRGLIVRTPGAAIGLLARCAWSPGWDFWVDQYARGGHGGVALLDVDRLAADVAALRRQGADVVVLFAHWGGSYSAPDAAQRRAAESAARAGVDLVVGHHPHVAQPLARVGRTIVAYSLGNYTFGTLGHPALDAGLLLRAEIRKRRLSRLELWPIDVQNRRVQYRPVPLTGEHARAALAPLLAASRKEGADLVVEQDHAVLELPPPEGDPKPQSPHPRP